MTDKAVDTCMIFIFEQPIRWGISLSLLFLTHKNTHTHEGILHEGIKMDRYRVPAHFYDVSLIYIDTAAGNRGVLLKLNGTSFGGCEIFDMGQIVLSSFISANPVTEANGYRFADYYSLALHYPRISYFAIRNYFQIIRSLLSSIASINNWAITRTSGRSIENRLRLSIRDSRALIRIRIILVLKILAVFRPNRKLNYRDLSAMFLSVQFSGNV